MKTRRDIVKWAENCLERAESYLDSQADRLLDFVDRHRLPVLVTGVFHFILAIAIITVAFSFGTTPEEDYMTVSFREIARYEQQLRKQQYDQPDQPREDSRTDNQARTSRASNLAATEELSRLRERLTSLNEVDNVTKRVDEEGNEKKVDLFSEEAKQVRTDHAANPRAVKDGEIEKEVYTGQSRVSFELSDRYELDLRSPVYTGTEGGKVVVDIKVKRDGTVSSAEINKSFSQTGNQNLWDAALRYARLARFNVAPNAPDPQYGRITYLFQNP